MCFSLASNLLETFQAVEQGRFPSDILENEETVSAVDTCHPHFILSLSSHPSCRGYLFVQVRMLKAAYTHIEGMPFQFEDNDDDK